MKFRLFYKNFFVILGIDTLLLTCSLYIAYLVRFDFNIPHQNIISFFWILPFVLGIKIASFFYFDLYRGMWRYTSVADLLNVIKASTITTLLLISYILLRFRFVGFPRSVYLIDWCFTILFISGFRLAVRIFFEKKSEN